MPRPDEVFNRQMFGLPETDAMELRRPRRDRERLGAENEALTVENEQLRKLAAATYVAFAMVAPERDRLWEMAFNVLSSTLVDELLAKAKCEVSEGGVGDGTF